MPRILARADNLNEINQQFEHSRLEVPLFLNSVPKCGTHLMRNIMRMFVPLEQQYHNAFIQIPILNQHLEAFRIDAPKLSWGHLLFSDNAAIALRKVNHIVLVRDPYDWVLARARFFLSDTFRGSLEHLKGGKVSVEDVLNMMIFGIYDKAPSLQEMFLHNAVSWFGTHAVVIRFEDLVRNSKELDSARADTFFGDLFEKCGIGQLPADWRERIRIGADRGQSGTARENLAGDIGEVPDELPETQKRLVDFAAPGLREILGYC